MTRIGIMQGRLCPPEGGVVQAFPVRGWRDEFPRAAAAGLATIEWIYDTHGEGTNPIETDAGIAEILTLSEQHGVAVASLCADWLMPNRLVRAPIGVRTERIARLAWLLERCSRLGVERVVLPFVDESALLGADDETEALEALGQIVPDAERHGIELHLETALGPEDFASFLERVLDPLVRVNYDSGNSASLGYSPGDEFQAYGERIGSVHVKDRVRDGMTVPLGTGDANLPLLFRELADLGYEGDIVLQVARGLSGEETSWAAANCATVEMFLKAAHA